MNRVPGEKRKLSGVIWKALAEKGKIATIIGLALALPFNAWVLWMFFSGLPVSEDSLWTMAIMNAVGMFWFMLPSSIVLKSKVMVLEVKD
ncbi:MAG: hypothetical protein PQJ59_01880 [Spirochaetales bacterium]|nr:hypothetical protein [Spirochaetales bacterium]